MERRTAQQHRQLFRQQCAVGGNADPEVQLPAAVQDVRQLRVEQRLPQHVEIEIIGAGAQLFRQTGKGRQRDKLRRAHCSGAEGAGEVAHVGDLQICAVKHGLSPPLRKFPVHCTTLPPPVHQQISCRGKKPCLFRAVRVKCPKTGKLAADPRQNETGGVFDVHGSNVSAPGFLYGAHAGL